MVFIFPFQKDLSPERILNIESLSKCLEVIGEALDQGQRNGFFLCALPSLGSPWDVLSPNQ